MAILSQEIFSNVAYEKWHCNGDAHTWCQQWDSMLPRAYQGSDSNAFFLLTVNTSYFLSLFHSLE
jgi:hypothetical protein